MPQIGHGLVLIRVERALIWRRTAQPSAARRLWMRYPQAARKWLDYARHEGLRSTYHKTRARLDSIRVTDEGMLTSLCGWVAAIDTARRDLAVGDRVAGFGFGRPAYAGWLLLADGWCFPVADNTSAHAAAALLPGLIALDWARTDGHDPEKLLTKVLAGDLGPVALPDRERDSLNLYSGLPITVPDWARTQCCAEYFDRVRSGTFEKTLNVLPEKVAARAGDRIKGNPLYVIGGDSATLPARQYSARRDGVHSESTKGVFGMGLIGAGDYARSILIPALQRERAIERRGVADLNPGAAAITAARYDFAFASANPDTLFNDRSMRGLLIAGYHDSHAPHTIHALERGVAAFVEKPLVTSWAQFEALMLAYEHAEGKAFVACGFNRRFAPALVRLHKLVQRESGALTIVCVVRGHTLPPGHWYYGAAQGTQIAGNICHWIDLCMWLTRPAIPVSIAAIAPPGSIHAENVAITLTFDDGSLAAIIFTQRGDDLRGVQESIEVRRDDLSATVGGGLDSLRAVRGGRVVTAWHGARDKGHNAELKAVLGAMRSGAPPPIAFREAMLSSALTLTAIDALAAGHPIVPDRTLLAHIEQLP